MRRITWIMALVVGVTVVLTGCGKKDAGSVVNDLDQLVGKMDSYQASGTMTLQTGQEPQDYQVEVWYKSKHYYRISLVNEKKDISQIVLRNDEGVFVLTPHLNKSFRFKSDWPENQGQVYLYQSLVQSIIADKARQFTVDNGAYVFDVTANYQNASNLARQRIWLNKKNYAPQHVEVSDANANIKVIVDFKQFEFGKKFDKDSFDMKRNMTAWNLKNPPTAQQKATGDTGATKPDATKPDKTKPAVDKTSSETLNPATTDKSAAAKKDPAAATTDKSAAVKKDPAASTTDKSAAVKKDPAASTTDKSATAKKDPAAGSTDKSATAKKDPAAGSTDKSATAKKDPAAGTIDPVTGATITNGAGDPATSDATVTGTKDPAKAAENTDAAISEPVKNPAVQQLTFGLIEPSYTPRGVNKPEIIEITLAGSKAILMRYSGDYHYTIVESKPLVQEATASVLNGDIVDLGFTLAVVTGDDMKTLQWLDKGMEFRLSTGDLPVEEMVKIAMAFEGQSSK